METLQNMLQVASQKLGVAVDYVYAVLLQQAKVELVFDIILLVALLLVMLCGWLFVRYAYKRARAEKYSDWDTTATIATILTSAFTLFSSLTVIPECIMEIVQIVVNPPVWVLEYLMNLVK